MGGEFSNKKHPLALQELSPCCYDVHHLQLSPLDIPEVLNEQYCQEHSPTQQSSGKALEASESFMLATQKNKLEKNCMRGEVSGSLVASVCTMPEKTTRLPWVSPGSES